MHRRVMIFVGAFLFFVIGTVGFSNVMRSSASGLKAGDLAVGKPVYYYGGTAVTTFTRDDGSLDPKPNDRLAIYCKGSTVSVIVIDKTGRGIYTVNYNAAQLKRFGLNGVMVQMGGKLGSVCVNYDGKCNLYAAWNSPDATYGATGVGDYSKLVTCCLP